MRSTMKGWAFIISLSVLSGIAMAVGVIMSMAVIAALREVI